MIKLSETTRNRIKHAGSYSAILQNVGSNGILNGGFYFEAVFLDCFLRENYLLDYEVCFLKDIDVTQKKSIDFSYEISNQKILFELINPEKRDELKKEVLEKEYTEGVILSSHHKNIHLRPEDQTFRMQEKIFGKIEKFPEPENHIFSIIVVNCGDFHFGHYDIDDVYSVMYGTSITPAYQEYWNGTKVLGSLSESLHKRGAAEFQRKISAVIFIRDLNSEQIFSNSWIAVNSNRDTEHINLMKLALDKLSPTSKLTWVSKP